jgi:hypothetical protein
MSQTQAEPLPRPRSVVSRKIGIDYATLMPKAVIFGIHNISCRNYVVIEICRNQAEGFERMSLVRKFAVGFFCRGSD